MTEATMDVTGKLPDFEISQGVNPRVDFWQMHAGLNVVDALMRAHAAFGKAPDPNEFFEIYWAFRRVHADARHLQKSLEDKEII